MNVIITVFCCLDTANVAVPVFGVCILLPVMLQFSGGVLYMYIVAPLKGLFGTRKDKDENYNALFEERFNTRVTKKPKKPNTDGEITPRNRQSSMNSGGNGFIRRANSVDVSVSSPRYAPNVEEVIEEEIDSDEEAELQQDFQNALLTDMKKKGKKEGGGKTHPPNIGRVGNGKHQSPLHQSRVQSKPSL